jgi:hypothetical protein
MRLQEDRSRFAESFKKQFAAQEVESLRQRTSGSNGRPQLSACLVSTQGMALKVVTLGGMVLVVAEHSISGCNGRPQLSACLVSAHGSTHQGIVFKEFYTHGCV